jgi:hypothetical protein
MRRGVWLAAGLLVLPAVAEEPASAAPDAALLEFLAETAGEDEAFVEFVESDQFDGELRQVEEQRAAPKDGDNEH